MKSPVDHKDGSAEDLVNHPPHYTSSPAACACGRGVECIQITRHMNFNLGNAFKYIWRAGLKTDDAVQDLEKSIWYIQDEIKRLKGEYDVHTGNRGTTQRLHQGRDRA